jgi:NOL1/NOP2/sun family putative RNA methylase
LQLPPSFINSIKNTRGFSQKAFELVHQSGEQITSIRINPLKTPNEKPAITNEKIPWCKNGFYLTERPSFTLDPLFHAGAYYVQEASSMFLEQALKQTTDLSQPIKVLDLCAAPGGKSTLIQSLIRNESLLVSNELIKTRVTILAENITKWGVANVVVTNNDPVHFQRLPNFFDVIVVDAPCSGSGLFRKDPHAINEWNEPHVEGCSFRQQRILRDVLPSLKEGGTLIYSTCSYSTAENETIADWLIETMQMESCQLEIDKNWGIVETQSEKHHAFGYRFYPDKVKGEGFFIAAFKKTGKSDTDNIKQLSKKYGEKLSKKEIEVVSPFLQNAAAHYFIQQGVEAFAIPLQLENEVAIIQSNLYIKKAGIKLGQIMRTELIPDHQLALSTIINPSLNAIETEREIALQYLRRQEIKIDSSVKGWALLTYKQLPLGWMKVLANRINNYYPKEWRILNK